MQNQQDPLSQKPKKAKRETINELAHRHLRDEAHVTSDEEIRNATVEVDSTGEVADDSLYEIDNTTLIPSTPFETNSEDPEKDDNDRKDPPNPYDVLDR